MTIEKDLTNKNEDKDVNRENMIDFISGTHTATLSFTNRRHINHMKKLYADRFEEFKYFRENEDGSICCKVPMKWIKINAGAKPDPNRPKRKAPSAEHMKKMHEARKAKLNQK